MKTVREITDLKGKKVLLRVDFDVPVKSAQISEPFRIEKQKETLDYLVKAGAQVVMVSHLKEGSFAELIPQLHMLLGYEINFLKKIEEIEPYLQNYALPAGGQAVPALLENIRQYDGEKNNDDGLAQSLAKGFDLYVNNAFAVCHRAHASVSAITKYLPSYAGFLIEEEVSQLQKALTAPAEGKVIIMGGAKAETKLPVIKNFIGKADQILLGGVIVNDILKFQGQDIGASVVDENVEPLLAGLSLGDPGLVMPEDYNISEARILDIGPKAIDLYMSYIREAKMIIWNGPMGLFEDDHFAEGTRKIAQAIAECPAYKIVGGGDSIAALNKFNIALTKFSFASTGGGAMLAFLSGQELPGLKALES